ncbi:hypothetical protein B7463_g1626, partial [Scytalidium lignicola]
MAPRGKNMTTARPITIPWALSDTCFSVFEYARGAREERLSSSVPSARHNATRKEETSRKAKRRTDDAIIVIG